MADENGTPEAVPGNVLEGEHLLLGGSMEPDAQGRPEAAWYGDGAGELHEVAAGHPAGSQNAVEFCNRGLIFHVYTSSGVLVF